MRNLKTSPEGKYDPKKGPRVGHKDMPAARSRSPAGGKIEIHENAISAERMANTLFGWFLEKIEKIMGLFLRIVLKKLILIVEAVLSMSILSRRRFTVGDYVLYQSRVHDELEDFPDFLDQPSSMKDYGPVPLLQT